MSPSAGSTARHCAPLPGRESSTAHSPSVSSSRAMPSPVAAVVGGAPGLAAVLAPGRAAAARLVGAPLGARMPRDRVDVGLRAGPVVLPRLAAVGRAHEPAELDADEDEVGVVRARRDPAHVRRPRPRREAPPRARRKLEQRVERAPALAAVVAAEQAARFSPSVYGAIDGADGE